MPAFCLIPEFVNKFKQGLRDGSIDPGKLSSMTSEQRNQYLENFVGKDNATNVNALFESKLLLQNQKAGMISWAKKVAGLSVEAKKDMIAKIEKLDKVLNPKEQEAFLHDLASQKLGADINPTEAKTIFDLSQKIKETRANQGEDGKFTSEDQRLDYGRSKVALMNYVNDLKADANKTGAMGYVKNPIKAVSDVAGNAKSIKASLDNSAIFRQGWKTLFTHPLTWQKNARQSFVDLVKTVGGKKVMDEINADIISRPNYDRMVKAKLAVGTIEEAYPGTVAEKIPLAGRLYKASENAYTGFVYRQRADIFDKYLEIAQHSGLNIDDGRTLRPIASMVNSLTGRGNFGKYEGTAVNLVNNVFFSPRFVKAQIDTLMHPITGAGGSNFVRKEAAINLVKIVTGTAAVLTIAKAINPGSVETDPRSSDFGKIRVGDTRFDVTGGASSLITLASRLIENSSKSSTTGIVKPLDSGTFGSQTKKDVVVNFFENKLSPVASVVKDLLKGKDFNGNPITPGGEVKNLLEPLPISNYEELQKNPNSAPLLITLIADGLGIGANTYGQNQTNWDNNPGSELKQFKDAVGQDKFTQANDQYNQQYNDWFQSKVKTDEYKSLTDESKQALITQKKTELKSQIFKDNSFKYKKAPSTKKDTGAPKSLFKSSKSKSLF